MSRPASKTYVHKEPIQLSEAKLFTNGWGGRGIFFNLPNGQEISIVESGGDTIIFNTFEALDDNNDEGVTRFDDAESFFDYIFSKAERWA